MKNFIILIILLFSVSCSSVKTGFEVKEMINGKMVTVKEFKYKSSKDITVAGIYNAETKVFLFELKSLASPVIAAKGDAYQKGIESSSALLEVISRMYLASQGLPVFGTEVVSKAAVEAYKVNQEGKPPIPLVNVNSLPEPTVLK